MDDILKHSVFKGQFTRCREPTWSYLEMEALRLQADTTARALEGILLFLPVLLQSITQVALVVCQGELPSTTGA